MSLKTTLEQWELLQSIVQEGSFAKAAEKFNRSQSAISYKVSLLQERLGVPLLAITGRKAELTKEGLALLEQARPILRSFYALEKRALVLKNGDKMRLRMAVDSIFPKRHLFKAMRAFQRQHPTICIDLMEVLRSESTAQLIARQADIYLITKRDDLPGKGNKLIELTFMAVVSASHPLLMQPSPLMESTLAAWPRIELTHINQYTPPKEALSVADSWTFTTIEAAIDAISHGIGYGWLPIDHIEKQLQSGELVPLPLMYGQTRSTSLYLVIDENSKAFDNEISALANYLSFYATES
ncbi:LysR family transcriptional regulator [Brenneria uluponensis]|uniref:LysR family transcriptional regulator n=1 Tax=Brenneria uluponensis TaxID=3057057 RepID=UPI0028E773F4|nr:LysR family transcriptional regulator [Brenneria ulupoensis]